MHEWKGMITMKKMRNLAIMAALCTMIVLISGYSSVNASPVGPDPKETVIKASQKLLGFKNYHMTLATTTSMAVQGKHVKSVVKSEFDVQVNPLLGKNNMDITTYADANIITQKLVQYLEQSGDQLIVYSNADNQWFKQSIPLAGYNPLKQHENYIKAIKSATVKSEDAKATVFAVVADGSYMKEELKRNMALAGMQKIQLTDEFLKGLNDLTYEITIDKQTGTISRMEMDLSDFMSRFGTSLVETMQMPDDKKTMIREMFSSMKIVMNATFSQFNKVRKITIPQEAKQAQELKQIQKATSL
jgi:hypothetical protein